MKFKVGEKTINRVKVSGTLRCGPYKGYHGRAAYDSESVLFHGQVLGLRDVITFQGQTLEELLKAFVESVDEYLAFCAQRGEAPEKPFSGKFLARVNPTLHKRISDEAQLRGVSLNTYVASTLKRAVGRRLELGKPSVRRAKRTAGRKSKSAAGIKPRSTARKRSRGTV